jgi:hypothetical protein
MIELSMDRCFERKVIETESIGHSACSIHSNIEYITPFTQSAYDQVLRDDKMNTLTSTIKVF